MNWHFFSEGCDRGNSPLWTVFFSIYRLRFLRDFPFILQHSKFDWLPTLSFVQPVHFLFSAISLANPLGSSARFLHRRPVQKSSHNSKSASSREEHSLRRFDSLILRLKCIRFSKSPSFCFSANFNTSSAVIIHVFLSFAFFLSDISPFLAANVMYIFIPWHFYFSVTCTGLKSHALSVSLTHFDVISRSHALTRICTLLEGNSTVLAVRSAYNRKIPSIERVTVQNSNIFWGSMPPDPLNEARAVRRSLSKQTHSLENYKFESSEFPGSLLSPLFPSSLEFFSFSRSCSFPPKQPLRRLTPPVEWMFCPSGQSSLPLCVHFCSALFDQFWNL